MEPRMLDKINSLNFLRSQRERCQEEIENTTNELLDAIREIAMKADIPGYMIIRLGNSLSGQT